MTDRLTTPAPSLRSLQRQMAAYVLDPSDAGLAALTPWLALPPGTAPVERLAVYVDGYPARLQEALAEQFPAVAHLLGGRRFGALVHRYAAAAALRSYSLNDAGAELAAFLATDALRDELPFLADLARLEWAVVRAFHADEQPRLDAAALAGWSEGDWAAAVLRFQPSVALIASPWPLRTLWEARDTPREEIDVDLRAGDRVVVRRQGFAVTCTSVSAGEAEALRRLLGGESLGAATAALAESGQEPEVVLGWFAGWTAAGMVVAVER